ncbi:MAG: tRNA dihydrouridine synthase DusB, partial [Clostridia bacterium]|nr:tRNA dihydrouridine synthase DusB [Clostridia bacterium]
MTDFAFLEQGAMLAPMAGVTDMPFRVLCHEMGCPMAVSEMVSAKGFLLSPRGNRASRELLAVSDREEGAVALQIFGHEPEVMAQAAEELTRGSGFAMLDINMGCPVPKIVGNGEGSALMKNPELAACIVREVVQASHIPVTVKMRLGFEQGSETYLQLGPMLEEAGAAMITLHARTRSQYYEGHSDWEAIRKLKARVGIPVVGNGDITCWQDALAMREQTGCDGVAVGRAAQGNPWIFEQIRNAMQGKDVREIPAEEKLSVLMRHARMLQALKGESVAVREMRRHIVCYV